MLFYGTISYAVSVPPIGMGMDFDMTSSPMKNQPTGELQWAVENIYKQESTAVDTAKHYWYMQG